MSTLGPQLVSVGAVLAAATRHLPDSRGLRDHNTRVAGAACTLRESRDVPRTIFKMARQVSPLPCVSSLTEAERTARDFESVISLGGAGEGRRALKSHPRRLYCPFDDILDNAEEEGAPAGAEQVREILEFAAAAKLLLVHCKHGQSRSTAVALGVSVARGMTPEDAARGLLQAHPHRRYAHKCAS